MSTDYHVFCYTCKKYCPDSYITEDYVSAAITRAAEIKEVMRLIRSLGKDIDWGMPELWDFPRYMRFAVCHQGHDMRIIANWADGLEDFTEQDHEEVSELLWKLTDE